jgi:hydrogenase maturation factor
MCITRVGRVLSVTDRKAGVEFFDGRTSESIDLSMVHAGKGDFVEVFGNMALSILTPSEARRRKVLWKEISDALGEERIS